jgi:hypothetical protein
VLGLVRSFLGNTDVGGLLVGQLGELGVEFPELEPGHLLVQMLGKGIDADVIASRIGEDLDLEIGRASCRERV